MQRLWTSRLQCPKLSSRMPLKQRSILCYFTCDDFIPWPSNFGPLMLGLAKKQPRRTRGRARGDRIGTASAVLGNGLAQDGSSQWKFWRSPWGGTPGYYSGTELVFALLWLPFKLSLTYIHPNYSWSFTSSWMSYSPTCCKRYAGRIWDKALTTNSK